MKFYYLVFQTQDGLRVGSLTAAGIGWIEHDCAAEEGWVTLDYGEAQAARSRTISTSRWFIVEEELGELNE